MADVGDLWRREPVSEDTGPPAEEGPEFEFSAELIEHVRQPRFHGQMLDADARAMVTGPCQDTMAFFLRLDHGRIGVACFDTDGCAFTLACGSKLATMVQGQLLIEAASIEPKHLEAALGGLPADHQHCADLAVATLRRAIADYVQRDEDAPPMEA